MTSFAFFNGFCHHRSAMQKVEKWRLMQLFNVLVRLSELLKRGGDVEWANVFSHFGIEIKRLMEESPLDEESLKRMITNIKTCFANTSSFTRLELAHDNPEQLLYLNGDFFSLRALLLKILMELEACTTEYIH